MFSVWGGGGGGGGTENGLWKLCVPEVHIGACSLGIVFNFGCLEIDSE